MAPGLVVSTGRLTKEISRFSQVCVYDVMNNAKNLSKVEDSASIFNMIINNS